MSTAHTTLSEASSAVPTTVYEHELVHMMDDIDTIIESTTNPVHRAILVNYRRHGLLEVSGRYDELLAADMTVRHPHYRIFEGGNGVILDGLDQVREFYRTLAEMDMLVMWTGRQKMAVADWGFAGEAEFSQFVPGRMLGDNVFGALAEDGDGAGSEETSAGSGYDPDAYYLVRRTLAFVWPYDDAVRMIGEHVYEDASSKVISKVSTTDVITGARAAELLAPIIDKYPLVRL
ncbi:hypothetical protein [Gordonia insulae]|uniref:SnoaL-like domain-containing protein n=1 Tax=Gordonia insulae TaxID=2420509 RepID=A0A3G8JI11_9ACTN|nr:hypothetical protein [Gordonia insulae]AZG44152.1 hypothetical protein D7316_00732 [Gordonia insulae]